MQGGDGDEAARRSFGTGGKYDHFLFTRFWAAQYCHEHWDAGCDAIRKSKEPWQAKHFVLETVRGQYDKSVDGHTHPEVGK